VSIRTIPIAKLSANPGVGKTTPRPRRIISLAARPSGVGVRDAGPRLLPSMGAPATGVNLDKALRLATALEDEETIRELALRK